MRAEHFPPAVFLQSSWTQIYSRETVTLRCEIQGGEGAQWTYEWRRNNLDHPPTSSEYRISSATKSDSGRYSCRGKRSSSWTEWSDVTKLTVSCKDTSWPGPGNPVVFTLPSVVALFLCVKLFFNHLT
uniref:Ig-like domain-containing protein n=1 Tax=Maylandia zebra TaxID=106582 RepID=A0A3P9D3Q5_9CICH